MLEESYRRIYPVIRDTNNIILGGSTGWNIQNSSGTLNFNDNSTNELSLSSGGNLSLNNTLPSISKHSDVSISSLTNNQTGIQAVQNGLMQPFQLVEIQL